PETEIAVSLIDLPEQQLEITLARRDQPRAALRAAERSLRDDGRVRAADAEAQLRSIARALTHVEVELGAETVAVALGIRAVEQRDAVENVAVHHRDRPAVLHLLDGMQQEGRRNAVEREVHARERAPAHRELAAEI